MAAGSVELAALAWGPQDGPVALCLHGYPDTAWTWRHLGPRLARDGWRVVAPFLRGYGPSDLAPDGDYSGPARVADAVALWRALGDDRAVLIGHDWGASIAHATPPLFAKVVTLAVPPVTGTVLSAAQARSSSYMLVNRVPGLVERRFEREVPRLWGRWSPGYDATEDIARTLAALDTRERRTAALSYYRQLRVADVRGPAPRVPHLHLHGAQDGCILPAFARRAYPALEMVHGAGHWLHLEQPDQVNERIADFIRR